MFMMGEGMWNKEKKLCILVPLTAIFPLLLKKSIFILQWALHQAASLARAHFPCKRHQPPQIYQPGTLALLQAGWNLMVLYGGFSPLIS